MSEVLKEYLDAERGRGAWLADKIGHKPSYISELASGKKKGSIGVWRKIARATGLSLEDLAGEAANGMSEGEATPYQPGPRANRLRDMVATLFPGLRHPSYFKAASELMAFAILEGDLLVTEANFDPDDVSQGQLVVASAVDESGSGRTLIARVAHPWLIDGKGHISAHLGADASVLGVVQIVVRSGDPAAFQAEA